MSARVFENVAARAVSPPRLLRVRTPAVRSTSCDGYHISPCGVDTALSMKSARTPPFHPVMSELPGLMDSALAEAYAGSSAVKPLIDRFLPPAGLVAHDELAVDDDEGGDA